MKKNKCVFCNNNINTTFLNLGNQPIANFLLKKKKNVRKFPLHIQYCNNCNLVQSTTYISEKYLFDDYVYFSSYSKLFLEHAKKYVNEITKELNLSTNSNVIEIASNDGYLLKNFVEKKINCLGIEPAKNVAKKAKQKGIRVINDFFNYNLSKKIKFYKPDLVIANNVLAHNMNLKDFMKSLSNISDKKTVITIEFPSMINLIKKIQFDTIYHEHFFYFSTLFLFFAFQKYNLIIYKAKKIKTHGGSIRIYLKKDIASHKIQKSVLNILKEEKKLGLNKSYIYKNFSKKVIDLKKIVDNFFSKKCNKVIYGFGAAAKSNTFLNFFSIKNDKIKYIIDETPAKINKYSPGNNIKIKNLNFLKKNKPDYVVILAWNHKAEILEKLKFIKKWNGKFVIFIPNLKII